MPYNPDMTHITLTLPFGLPPAALARDLLRAMHMPALATLLARSSATHHTSDDFAPALPHETWLARQYGLAHDAQQSPALAQAARQACELPAAEGTWFRLQPVHFHVARDHLVLTDTRLLEISEAQSRTLFASVVPLFEELGMPLAYGSTHSWFVRADNWSDLQTSTADAACGHNITIWLPKGDAARDWRRLQNEVQMTWHDDAVNRQREQDRQPRINALWLSGAAVQMADMPKPFSHISNPHDWLIGLTTAVPGAAAELVKAAPAAGLVYLDTLSQPALAGDWAEWLARMQSLETLWFAPLLAGLKSGQLDALTLVLSHNTALSEWRITRQSLRKFWRTPSLSRLTP